MGPSTKESANTTHIFHQAAICALKLSIVDRLIWELWRRRLRSRADASQNHQQAEHPAKKPHQYLVVKRCHHQAGPIRRRLLTTARARSRKPSLFSWGSTWIGLPKVSRLNIGTGRYSPLGKIRFIFSK